MNFCRKNKGQALVEFVIILPIFIFMILATIDIGKIILVQNTLEGEMTDVVSLYRNSKTYDEISSSLSDDVSLEVTNEDNESVTFTLKRDVSIVTPGLNLVIPGTVSVSRVIVYE